MTDRILAWLSAGVLAAGVSAATIAGAAMAAADDDAGANATTSTQSTASTGNETESDADKPSARTDPVDRATDATVTDDEADEPADNEAADDEAEEPADDEAPDDSLTDDEAEEPAEEAAEEVETAVGETESGSEHDGAIGVDEPEATPETSDLSAAADQAHDTALAVTDKIQVTDAGLAHTPDLAAEREPVVEASTAETATTFDAQPSPAAARLVMTAAPQVAPAPTPSLLNVVGSFFWGLFDMVTKLIDFPPVVPPGSTVTAGRGTLQIDCGDGYTTDADWYFPTEGEPDKFIYFQHGFPARAGFYNLTLAELAERNNAIVVAPNITSNIFACDACALSGEPMQAAVAKLFEGDRAALLASARACRIRGHTARASSCSRVSRQARRWRWLRRVTTTSSPR